MLAAIDLTPLGRRVADRARLVAEETDAAVTLLHCIEPLTEALVEPGVAELIRDHRIRASTEVTEWCAERSDAPVESKTVKGAASYEIVKASKGADLVVVGSSTIDNADVGPTAFRVAETARSDVLIVRRQPRVPYRRVVVGVDLSEGSALAVEAAMRWAPEAEVTIAYILPTRFDPYMLAAGMFPEEVDRVRRIRLDDAGLRLEEFAERWPGRVRPYLTDGPAETQLEDVARRRNADLVVVGSRGVGATKIVLLGTVAASVLRAMPSDVLIARVPGDFRRP
ncbi:MAG: universal stress protein [Acidimicrobiia bacterium]|nr:universal stress protein [Acidimicrobiia bacterium]